MASATPLWSHRLTFIVLICCYMNQLVSSAAAIKYCSSLNTGSDFNPVFYKFQSYGECYGTCTKDNNFALSVIQGKNCWCSDYAPSVTTDTDDCHEACPGYPDDICGGPNLFVYYQLNKVPVGTKGGSSPTSDTTSQITVTKEPDPPQTETVFITPKPDTQLESSSSSSSSTKPPPTAPPVVTEKSSTITTSPPWTPTPSISVETLGQSVRTVTVTPTTPPAAASVGASQATKEKSGGGGGLGTGGAVGLAIGLIALFAIIGGVGFWLFKKRKGKGMEEEARRNMHDSKRSSTSALRTDMTRSMSQHSRFVLGSNGQTVVGGFEPVTPTVEGSGSSRISAHGLKPVDPRLDPFGVAYGNRSRESLNTINDGHDYTRKILRTTNPDPDNDD